MKRALYAGTWSGVGPGQVVGQHFAGDMLAFAAEDEGLRITITLKLKTNHKRVAIIIFSKQIHFLMISLKKLVETISEKTVFSSLQPVSLIIWLNGLLLVTMMTEHCFT